MNKQTNNNKNIHFLVSQVERNFAPGWIIQLGDESWDFLSWLYLYEILELELMLVWIKNFRDVELGEHILYMENCKFWERAYRKF